jgi:membrane fusion protein, copper/silver efflux system
MPNTLWIVKILLKHPTDMKVFISSILLTGLFACSQENRQTQQVVPAESKMVSRELMLTVSQIKLANITTQLVRNQDIGQILPVNARLVVNEELTEMISSRATGRIERLFVKEEGRMVNKGEPLYELYSESLLTLQKEYLLALEQYKTMKGVDSRYEDYLKSARKKLLLYGLTDKQIDKLVTTHDIQPRITFMATASGVVKEIKVSEGQYLSEGDVLYQLENINKLWVEAELYPTELQYVKTGDHISVRISGYDNITTETSVTFLSPEYRANTQVTVLRASLNNQTLQWKPGMQAQVILKHSEKTSLAIPTDAVIHDQSGAHVYIQTADNTFAPRMVKTGVENFDSVEITEGIKEGEIVVVTGAYLLYSELILKNGIDPLLSHNH